MRGRAPYINTARMWLHVCEHTITLGTTPSELTAQGSADSHDL